MGKMSEIDHEVRSWGGLIHDLRSYPEHYDAAHKAADRIEELEKAIGDYAASIAWMEGVTFVEYIYDDVSKKIVVDILNARAALRGEDA